jgi:hypothetical protein
MATAPKLSKTETPGPEGRRSTRLPIAIPITISGKDASGASFRENVHTLVVNTHGAKVITCHELTLGVEILIENPALVRSVRANVVWVGKKPGPSGLFEVGVQLLQAQNIWGIGFPPDDWQAEVPAGGGVSEATKTTSPAGTKPRAVPGAAQAQARPGEPLPFAAARPIASAVARGAEVGPPEQSDAATDGALRRFNQLLAEAADRQRVLFGEKLTKVTGQIGLQTQSRLQDEARNLQEKTIRAMEQESNALAARLQATYGKVESLLAKLYEIEQGSRAQVDKTQQKLKEAGRQTLEDTLEELRGKAKPELETLSADSIKQLHQRLEREVAGQIEAAVQAASPRLTALTEEHLAKLVPELQAQQAQTISETQAQLRDTVQTATAHFRQELKKPTEEMAASLRAETEMSVEKAAQAVHQLRKECEELAGSTTRQVQHQVQEARETLEKDLAQSGKTLVEEIYKSLAKESKELLDSSVQQAQRAAKEVHETLSTEFSQSSKALAEEIYKNLAKESKELLDSSVQQAQRAAKEVHETLSTEFSQSSNALLAETQQKLADLVNSSAESASQRALAEFKNQCAQVVSEHSEAIGKQLELSMVALVERADQTRTRLETYVQKIEETSRSAPGALEKQADELLQKSMVRMRQEAEALTNEASDNFRAKLAEVFSTLQAFSPKSPARPSTPDESKGK